MGLPVTLDHLIIDPRNFRFIASGGQPCDSGGETVETSDDDEEEEEEEEELCDNNNVEDDLGWEDEVEHWFPELNEPLTRQQLSLKSLKWIATLGVGGFGRVELVTAGPNNNVAFALKKMKKNEVSFTISDNQLNTKVILLDPGQQAAATHLE